MAVAAASVAAVASAAAVVDSAGPGNVPARAFGFSQNFSGLALTGAGPLRCALS
jgi:hypothetical protein